MLEDFIARQLDPVNITGQVPVGEDVDIQGPAGILFLAAHPAVILFHPFQAEGQFRHRQGGANPHHQVVKGIPVKTHRFTFVNRADLQLTELGLQRLQPRADIVLAVDIGTQTEIHLYGL